MDRTNTKFRLLTFCIHWAPIRGLLVETILESQHFQTRYCLQMSLEHSALCGSFYCGQTTPQIYKKLKCTGKLVLVNRKGQTGSIREKESIASVLPECTRSPRLMRPQAEWNLVVRCESLGRHCKELGSSRCSWTRGTAYPWDTAGMSNAESSVTSAVEGSWDTSSVNRLEAEQISMSYS